MSSIKLSPNSSGVGIFTIAAPAGASDRTLTLPDSTGTIATAESTLSQFNASGSAPVYACRAWVNFNGTGTVAIRASGNVSSITDNGTGRYALNFTNALPDANYAVVSLAAGDMYVQINNSVSYSTTTVSVATNNTSNAGVDSAVICVSVFR